MNSDVILLNNFTFFQFVDNIIYFHFVLRWGEAYTWTNVNCCVHNVIVGKLWIEQYGTMEIVNHSTGNN